MQIAAAAAARPTPAEPARKLAASDMASEQGPTFDELLASIKNSPGFLLPKPAIHIPKFGKENTFVTPATLKAEGMLPSGMNIQSMTPAAAKVNWVDIMNRARQMADAAKASQFHSASFINTDNQQDNQQRNQQGNKQPADSQQADSTQAGNTQEVQKQQGQLQAAAAPRKLGPASRYA
jgi:hypothetical protein